MIQVFLKILDNHKILIELSQKVSRRKSKSKISQAKNSHSKNSQTKTLSKKGQTINVFPKRSTSKEDLANSNSTPSLSKNSQDNKPPSLSSKSHQSEDKRGRVNSTKSVLEKYPGTFIQNLSKINVSKNRPAPQSPKVPPVLFKVSSCFIQKLSNQCKGAKIVVNQSIAPQTRRGSILLHSNQVPQLNESKEKSIFQTMTGQLLVKDRLSFSFVPKGLTIPDFLIVTVVEFLERVELIQSCCSVFCTGETCPMFNVGSKYQFLWVDKDISKPIQVSAPEYFDYFKRWMKRQLSDQKNFPIESTVSFSTQATEIIHTIFRRLFRVLGHFYYCHFQNIKSNGIETILNTVLVHYTQIALMSEMIDYGDLEMLHEVYSKLGVVQE